MTDPWAFGWSQLFGLTTTVAVCFGAWIAWRGLRTWRLEQIERRQCELAEESLALMYEAKEMFEHVRSPLVLESEGSSLAHEVDSSSASGRTSNIAFAPAERLNSYQNLFERVSAIRPRLRAIFGGKAESPLTEILRIRHEILLAVKLLVHRDPSTPIDDDYRKFDEVAWKRLTGSDSIEDRIDAATSELEKLVEPLLNSRYRTRWN